MDDESEKSMGYRDLLQQIEMDMQSQYDKAIITLSGGGLGISLTFLKDVVLAHGIKGGWFLIASWVSWGFSLACVLYSFASSARAMRRAVDQTDSGAIHREPRGGVSDIVTGILNLASGLSFAFGLGSTIVFVWANLLAGN
jgi:hypothetical protein